ncbi:MAG: glycoside hydrolase family 28 protein [Armatimonadota bacterium]
MTAIIDIRDYGANPDGTTLNTAAMQQAIDACHRDGGGQVFCGPGRYLTGTLELKSNVELHLAAGCRIVGSTRLEDYRELAAPGFRGERAPEGSSKSLIQAVEAENIAITGPGALDGNGLAFYDTETGGRFFRKPATARPRIVTCFRCRNVRLQDVTLLDSPCWTVWLMKCERVAIHRVTVAGDQRMINNDGIDIDACRDVTISDCICKTADDCLVLRAINGVYDEPGICENVTITNCVLDSWCQGVRVGCPGDGVIRNAVFSNLTIRSAGNGIWFENPQRYLRDGCGSADIHNILFSNITIDCDGTPIGIIVEDGIALPRLSDLAFSNINIRSGRPCRVEGSPETVIRNVRFSNMRIDTQGDDAIVCRHCDGIRLTDVELCNRASGT